MSWWQSLAEFLAWVGKLGLVAGLVLALIGWKAMGLPGLLIGAVIGYGLGRWVEQRFPRLISTEEGPRDWMFVWGLLVAVALVAILTR